MPTARDPYELLFRAQEYLRIGGGDRTLSADIGMALREHWAGRSELAQYREVSREVAALHADCGLEMGAGFAPGIL